MSADLEAKANLLRKESLQCLTVALAGSDTKKFWELLTAYFGANHKGNEEDDPWDFLDAAPAIPPPLPLTETESEDEQVSVQSAPVASTAKERAPRQPKVAKQKDILPDLCELSKAIRMYPADKKSLQTTGIPLELQVKREHQTTTAGGSVYLCRHEKCQVPPFYAQSPAGIYSHIRRKHVGVALACPYCENQLYWNTKGWKGHMDKKHRNAPHYGTTLANEAAMAQEMLRVTEHKMAETPVSPKKRRVRRKAPKKEVSSSSSIEGTSGSSSDSSSDSGDSPSSDSSQDQSAKKKKCGKTSRQPLSTDPSTPQGQSVARREAPLPVRPGAAEVAASIVLADIKQEEPPDPTEGLEDMPELEATPPPPFPPGPPKKRRKEDV